MKWIIIIAAVLCLLLFLCIRLLSKNGYGRSDRPRLSYTWYYDHYQDRYPRRKFMVQSGKNSLACFVYGEENTDVLLVLSHGSGTFHEEYMKEIVWFVDHGYRVIAPDYTACGESEGMHSGGLPQTPIDLDAVLEYIEKDPELVRMKKVLFGHSWGAYGVTAVLNYRHEIAAVVSLAAYNDPAEETADILARVSVPAVRLLEPFFRLSDIMDHGRYGMLTAVKGINRSNISVLIVHGTGDQMISFEKCSLVAKKSKIHNPRTEYLVLTEPGHNDHDSFRYTSQAEDLLKGFRTKSAGLTGEELEVLYRELDMEAINSVNEAFMEKVDSFFRKALEEKKE